MSNNFISLEEKKKLKGNFLSLSVLQMASYLLPLLTLPYLVRVLGPEKFGLVMFAQAFILILMIFVEYGFNLSATKEVSVHRDDKDKINKIFNSVMGIKIILILFCLLVLSIIVFSIDRFSTNWEIYYLSFGMLIGQAILPIWFYQGIEDMKYITILNIFIKIIYTVSVFIFILEKDDYIYLPIINSVGYILIGLIALWHVNSKFKIFFQLPSFSDINRQLKYGFPIFITSLQGNLLASSSVFILGLFASNTIVGYYAAIEKLVKAFNMLFSPITQALFPLVSNKMKLSIGDGRHFLIKLGTKIMLFVLFVVSIIFIFHEEIVAIIFGSEYSDYSIILQILAPWLFLGVLNNFIGIQYLTAAGYSKYYMQSFSYATVLTLVLFWILTSKFSYYGLTSSMLIGELSLTIFMLYTIRKNNL